MNATGFRGSAASGWNALGRALGRGWPGGIIGSGWADLILAGALALAAAAGAGCAGPRAGSSRVAAGSVASSLAQPANASAPTVFRTREERQGAAGGATNGPAGGRWVLETETTLGPVHRDAAAEVAARLASFRPIQYLGALVFLLGVAAAAWAPARALVGSMTTAGVIAAAGLALVFLPTVIVGREGWILAAAGAGAGSWALAHRHGAARGELAALRAQGPKRRGVGR